jgi:hypothetical protein
MLIYIYRTTRKKFNQIDNVIINSVYINSYLRNYNKYINKIMNIKDILSVIYNYFFIIYNLIMDL